MSPETACRIREIAIDSLESLHHPGFGLKAGIPRFDALYGRDIHRFIRLISAQPKNWEIPRVLSSVILALDRLEETQATENIPDWEAQPGKVIHQWMNGFTPPQLLEELKEAEWPVFINSDNSMELRYFGGDDETPGYIDAVAIVAEALAIVDNPPEKWDEFLGRKWQSVKSAFNHQVMFADIDGDGLVESIPRNKKTLLHLTEKDANNAYDLENGMRPYLPFKYSGTNYLNTEAMRKMIGIATFAGDSNLASEASEFYQVAKAKIKEVFWDDETGYPTPLIFGERERADFISDEAADGLWYRIFDEKKAKSIVNRLMQKDMLTPWGLRSRSSQSKRFHVNGGEAYWSGSVWTHRTAIAAEAFEQYGFSKEAAVLDACLGRLVMRKGCNELNSVDRRGRLYDYREKGKPKACLPQLFAVGGVLARTKAA